MVIFPFAVCISSMRVGRPGRSRKLSIFIVQFRMQSSFAHFINLLLPNVAKCWLGQAQWTVYYELLSWLSLLILSLRIAGSHNNGKIGWAVLLTSAFRCLRREGFRFEFAILVINSYYYEYQCFADDLSQTITLCSAGVLCRDLQATMCLALYISHSPIQRTPTTRIIIRL